MERYRAGCHPGRNHRVNDGVTDGMPRSLPRAQVEYCAIDVDDGKPPFRQDPPEFLDRSVTDLGNEPELPRKAFELVDSCPFRFEVRHLLQLAFLNVGVEGREHHVQAGEGAGVILFLPVEG